jgi:protein involved in polysaccharide export with SLBB domain
VLGEVKRPGTYRIPASTRLSETLQLAGGIKKNGSERNIELRRSSSSRKMDLLAYRVLGQLNDNPYLMDNDVVYIPLKQKVIEVEGAVNRPGIYEIKSERRISDVLLLAGGFTQGVSHKDPVKIIRYDQDEKKNIIDVANSPEELKQTEIISGDVIVIPHMFTTKNEFDYNLKELPRDNVFYPSYEDRVFIIGAVEVPGAYDFNQYYKLSNYLALAGGMNRMAKGQVKIVTEEGKAVKVKPDDPILINPGDTIYVPEKALSRETWISILTTVASLGLTSAALFTR